VIDSEPIGILKLSLETGIPDHLVRYSLRVLEQQGLIAPSTQGAVATKSAKEAYSEFRTELEKIMEMTEDIKRLGFGDDGNEKSDLKYEYLYHIADAKFRAFGHTMEEVFENAALAMFIL